MQEDGQQYLVMEAISAAVMAGAYWAAIRQDPVLGAGFGRLARKHSARAATLASEFCEGGAVTAHDPAGAAKRGG